MAGLKGALAALILLGTPRGGDLPPKTQTVQPEPCPTALLDRYTIAPERAAMILSLWAAGGRCTVTSAAAVQAEQAAMRAEYVEPEAPQPLAGVDALRARLTAAGYVFDQKPALAPRTLHLVRERAAA
ncbi:MAG: hypothetical protein ABW199_05370 [Caulobacterales bacterium]